MAAKHRCTRNNREAYRWLGTGALTLGIGAAALAGGAGVAAAKTGDSSGTPSSSDHKATPTVTHKKSHGPSPTAATAPTAASTGSAPASAPAITPKGKQPKVTAAVVATAATKTPTPTVAADPTTPITTAAVVALKPLAAVTTTAQPAAASAASTTTGPTNPANNLSTAIQKALLGFQAMFFNTPPTIRVTVPTKNADGAYTGRITAFDADGDPLSVYSENPTDGGATTLRAVDKNTYEFTYTPSESALTTTGYIHYFDFSAQETNYADHWHGFTQLVNYLVFGHAKNAYGNPLYFPFAWGTSSSNKPMAIGPVARPAATVSSAASATPLAATAAAAANPLTGIVTAIQNALVNFQHTYFNAPPKVTVDVATKQSDGSYIGKVTATDADGDPLRYSVAQPYDGSTVTIDQSGNYTITPSSSAIAEGTQEGFTVTVAETNSASHYHGIGELFLRFFDTFMNQHFAGNGYYWYTDEGVINTYVPAFAVTTGTTAATTT